MTHTPLRFFVLIMFLCLTTAHAIAFDEDSLVVRKCIHCHTFDKGHLARISELRTTPEEWTVIIDRMHRLHAMPLKNGEMAALLKELCATQILTPEEAARVAYINLFNNPQTMETPVGSEETKLFTTCVRCHSEGKILSYRMTDTAWKKLRDFHLYIDPAIMYQMREMYWRKEADDVLGWLGREYPYQRAWKAPQSKLEGPWYILGNEPGRGNYRGAATLVASGDDDYTLKGTLSFSDGTSETFSGEATLYGGYALRTRTRHNGSPTMGAFSFVDGVISGEHQHNAPDFRTASSTWYPLGDTRRALRTSPGYLLSGEETHIVIEGFKLPAVDKKDIVPASDAVDVLEVLSASPEAIEVVLRYTGQTVARTRLQVKDIDAGELTLAPRIDYLRISPAMGRARVNGGANYPAEGVQFEAVAYSNGKDADAKDDDVLLGPVAAQFSLAEAVTRPGDDDLVHLGVIESDGTYIPSSDYNPLPSRELQIEGTGMVKVIAKYTRGTEPFSAEARLVVTVPDFIQRLR